MKFRKNFEVALNSIERCPEIYILLLCEILEIYITDKSLFLP